MKWKQQKLNPKTAAWWQKAVIALGIISDAAYNYSPLGGALALLQFPRRGEVLFTSHLQRIKKAAIPGYRYRVALTYCFILNFFDLNHCK